MSRVHKPPALYTTSVAALKTAGEVSGRLAEHGARSVAVDYIAGRPRAIAFSIDVEPYGELAFRLPVDVDAMARHLGWLADNRAVSRSQASPEQAERTAWRLMAQWLASQLSMVEAQQTTLAQTLLPYLLLSGGETVFERFTTSGPSALDAGPVHEGVITT